jgi:hypothetical protein
MKESSNDNILRPNPIKAQFKAPNFEIVSDGFFSANSSPEFDQAGKLNSNFSSFQFYPVIKLNIAYALKTF